MADKNEIKGFVEKVIEMRGIQREFFKTRSFAAMQTAKRMEKDVDDMAKKLLKKLTDEEVAAAPSLFGDEADA